jgi:hypothetical protein
MPAWAEPARRHAAFLRAGWGFEGHLDTAAVAHPLLQPGPPARLTLPPDPACHAAAVAHAAAHLAYGGPPFARGSLKPLQQALLGTLEDARVEDAALRELPGLRALWLPWHDAAPDSGASFALLLRRLQRRLLDPRHADPHPWLDKACRWYRDSAPTPAAMRGLASLLGHELGQLRLPFDATADTVGPPYRDDHRHLWEPLPAQGEAAGAALAPGGDAAAPTPPAGRRVLHPEWDWRIGGLRPGWCTVVESEGAAGPAAALTGGRWPGASPAVVTRRWHGRQPAGPAFDDAALVDAAVALRRRDPPPQRLYRAPQAAPARAAVLLLIDRSASTAAAAPPGWPGASTRLQAEVMAATVLGHGLAAAGHRIGVQAFASSGRHAVQVDWVRRFDEGATVAAARLAALHSAGSTRLGTALRHAVATLRQHRGLPLAVLVLTDGEPHDIDVHERRYLLDDLAQAVRAARQAGVSVGGLLVGSEVGAPSALRRCFGAGRCVVLRGAADLPAAAALVG